ncbi:MAG: agmatine deiminase family protein, partial [Bacteroidales bacterium]|nr:agmatine deiminase family protein [Bacteroidales bacterium]
MKRLSTLIFLSLCLLINLLSQEQQIPQNKPFDTLTHHLQPWEAKLKHLNGESFYSTPPPTAPVRNVAEFQRMQGVLIRYPFGISYAVIAEMSEDIMVTTIVTNVSQENYVRGLYQGNGVNLSNCNFLHAPTNSYWTRDYGPWFVFDGNDNPGIVNFPYNRPRPDDDDIPIEVATFLGIDLYGMDIEHTGGNYMTCGMGVSSSTDLVWDENPGLTHTQIDQL